MSWWTDRKTLKGAREFVAGARKLLRIHRDLLETNAVQEIARACDDLAGAIRTKNIAGVPSLRDKLETKLKRFLPQQSQPALRENVEVLLVAVIAAMAIRTFFFQPFKIPTGSMQPTLYGVYPPRPPESEYRPPIPYSGDPPSIVERAFGIVFRGRIYETSGWRTRGDHIFVDRFTYHFRKPTRGEVIVFDTSDIADLRASSRGKFYIKRLIGLAGDRIEIRPPYVLVNGSILDERLAFRRIYSMQNGYSGYVLPPGAPYINVLNHFYGVPPEHLFVLGDNSGSSLDGRFWGSLPQKALVGRAVLVYWPFTERFGPVD